ncbi:hypothetical protein HGRIS_010958 [Hohenbuehelia grisea]|uniref:Protein kinase domain-containing protein n=1 Tax=Hohenbuehelia grisea TaxID=104357 RepID=A0ABR3IYC8_9AGAR
MSSMLVPHYFPPFLWKFMLSDVGQISHVLRDPRVHIYDMYENELTETRRMPEKARSVFQDFHDEDMANHASLRCKQTLADAEAAFEELESDAEKTLLELMRSIPEPSESHGHKTVLPMDKHAIDRLRTYLVFLRFRNCTEYTNIIASMRDRTPTIQDSAMLMTFRPFFSQIRRRLILKSFLKFLRHPLQVREEDRPPPPPVHDRRDPYQEAVNQYCWRFCEAEVCLGIASEKAEFIVTNTCFGTLNENITFGEDRDASDLFFPIIPTMAVYILANPEIFEAQDSFPLPVACTRTLRPKTWIECGIESASDVYLRNAMLLQTYPNHIYFSNLLSVAQSVSAYDEFRWSPEHQDYSRLKQRCRQKYTMEGVKKTLVVKGEVIITDLTDEVVRVGHDAVCQGSFSDVWKGLWRDPTSPQPRFVALKYLRQIMVQNVREKLMKRLQDEIIAWYRLRHPNISRFYGVIQTPNTIAMVSPWCDYGTITHYLKAHPSVNRFRLLAQIASGVAYLHGHKPMVVHGDLKGGNILIGEEGQALITDFGLSKVVEEMTDSMNLGTSFFAGSTRWMAPELILALVEDDGRPPPITPQSDVYSFASVCLEVVTGRLPYPHRTNDNAVTVDILRGIRPCRGALCNMHIKTEVEEAFWDMLNRCWDTIGCMRPSMLDMTTFFTSSIFMTE